MFRVEVCPRCGGEARILAFITEPAVVRRILVFDDGPPPTGKRYCLNSVALRFEKAKLR